MGRLFELLIALFLLIHIPITLFGDAQAVLGPEWFHPRMLDVMQGYLGTYHDPLMTPPHKPWFKSMIYLELFLQLPYFIVGFYAFVARKNWIRIPTIIYGTSVVTTMVPIFFELWHHKAPGYNQVMVCAFYAPYLFVPLAMLLKAAFSSPMFKPRGRAASSSHLAQDSLWGGPPAKAKWV